MTTPEEMLSTKITRRQALRYGVGVLGIFASACAPQPPLPAPPDRRNPTPTTAAKPTQEPEITNYYPELKNYQVLSKGEFTTSRTRTKWFNLSAMDFDPQTAITTFTFFESLGKRQEPINYLFSNQNIPFWLDQRPKTERVIFLIPQDAPIPNWDYVFSRATTTDRFTNGPYVTFVRVPTTEKDLTPSLMFTTPALAVNKAFSIEACQSSLMISSLTTTVANLGQEIVCNSYGPAFTLKQTGLTFDKYQSWAKDVLISQDPQSPSYPLYVLSEQEYNQIPKVGQIFK